MRIASGDINRRVQGGSVQTLHDGTGTRLGAKAPGGTYCLVSRNNSNAPEPGKTIAARGALETRIRLAAMSGHGPSKAHLNAPRSLTEVMKDCSEPAELEARATVNLR